MNAIKFIKLYGLNSARVTVEDAQENTHYCTETGYHSIKLDVAYEPCPDCVDLSELKRLVESVDLIKKHGGLFSTKCQLDKGGSDYEWYGENGDYGLTDLGDLEQAIADYESVYGESE